MKVFGAQCKGLQYIPITSLLLFTINFVEYFLPSHFQKLDHSVEEWLNGTIEIPKKGITLSQMDWQLSLFALMVCFMVFEEKNCFWQKNCYENFSFCFLAIFCWLYNRHTKKFAILWYLLKQKLYQFRIILLDQARLLFWKKV